MAGLSGWEDWNSQEDSAYDHVAREKAMREYREISQQIEDDVIAAVGQEEYEAREHWINNPLIKPRSKVAMFEEWEERIRKEVVDEIVEMLEDPSTMSNWWAMPDRSLGLYGNLKNYVIALIKGEK